MILYLNMLPESERVCSGICTMGWFFGFKLHLIINDKGEILNFMFTPEMWMIVSL